MKQTHRISTACDLSAVGALHAEETIRTLLEKKDTTEWYKQYSFILSVPSQTFGEGMKLCHLLGYQINLNLEYDTDEWSLTYKDYKEGNDITIHSPGA